MKLVHQARPQGPPHPPSGLPGLPWSREGWGPWCHTHVDRWEQPEGLTIGVASVLAILQLAHCMCPALIGLALRPTARLAAAMFCAVGAEPPRPWLRERGPESRGCSSWADSVIPCCSPLSSCRPHLAQTPLLIAYQIFLLTPGPLHMLCWNVSLSLSLTHSCATSGVQLKGCYLLRKTLQTSLTTSGYLSFPGLTTIALLYSSL